MYFVKSFISRVLDGQGFEHFGLQEVRLKRRKIHAFCGVRKWALIIVFMCKKTLKKTYKKLKGIKHFLI
jgi:hypothetical protein